MNNVDHKRIAKNTILLYFRMFFTMGVSLYTSRVILRELGVEDFGVYSVVGGVVTMLGFLNGAMTSGTQRYLSFALGRNDQLELKKNFSATLTIHIAIAAIALLIAESFGLWFINNELVIPADRMVAANWVYQFSILSLIVTITQVPYISMLIAHERMNIFALIGIADICLKLGVILSLQYFTIDKMALYSGLLFGVTLIITLTYRLYCSRHFSATKYKFIWESSRFKELISYAGWNVWGNLASVGCDQGLNILINIFFGPAVNAARAISFQVSSALGQFAVGFQMAMNPQLVKSYAAGHTDQMLALMNKGCKFSFLLMYLVIVPILFHTYYVLELWLGIVPEYTVIFCQLILITSLINTISGPLMTAVQATGKIKLYQSVVGGILLLNVPISYIFLKLGYPPQTTITIMIIIAIIALVARLLTIQRLLPFSALSFLKSVVLRPFTIGIITFVAYYYIELKTDGFFGLVLSLLVVELLAILLVATIGINRDEREFVYSKIKMIFKNKKS